MLAGKIGYFRPRGFDPRSISGLALWLDSADASTLFQNSDGTTPATATGDPIGYWRDKSGSGSHVTQATAANRPARAVGPFGKPTIDFDGVNDCLFCDNTAVTAAATGDKALTVFAIGQMQNSTELSITTLGSWWGFGSSSSGTPLLYMRSEAASGAMQIITRNDASSQSGSITNAPGPAGDGASASTAIDSFIASATIRTALSGLLTTGRIHTAMSAEGNGIGRNPPLLGSTAISPAARQGTSTLNRFTVGALGRNVFGDFFPARISEVLVYSRALSDAERVSVVQWLGSKYETVVYNAPVVSNADAQSWIDRVYANGGTVSAPTASAVNTFCNSIDSAGLRDRFYRLNLFAGTGLAAALVPLYRGQSLGGTQFGNATDTNTNFVSADYVETGTTGGLKGNGANKRLDTGLLGSLLLPGDRHAAAYEAFAATSDYSPSVLAVGANVANMHGIGAWTASTQYRYRTHSTIGGNPVTTNANGMWVGSDSSATASALYRNGALAAAVTGQPAGGAGAGNYQILGHSAGEWSEARLGGYSIGLSLSAAQVASFYNAMQAFQTALTRNV